MKKVLILLVISVGFFACSKPEGMRDLAATEFQKTMESTSDKQIVDVRTEAEYTKGHIDGAILADISSGQFQEVASGLDKDKPVFVYCLSGGRSSSAASQLQQMGFTSITNLSGGMLAWQSANLPVSTNASTTNEGGMTLAAFTEQVKNKKRVIVDYNAVWCGPCKQLSPVLETYIKSQAGRVELMKIDVDDNQALAQAKKIESIPYLEFYIDGKLVDKQIGMGDAASMTKKWSEILK